jgi:hypothetical protein
VAASILSEVKRSRRIFLGLFTLFKTVHHHDASKKDTLSKPREEAHPIQEEKTALNTDSKYWQKYILMWAEKLQKIIIPKTKSPFSSPLYIIPIATSTTAYVPCPHFVIFAHLRKSFHNLLTD